MAKYLPVWIFGLFVCAMLGVPFWGMLLLSIAFGLLLCLLRFYSSMLWAAYLLHGVCNRPELAFPLYQKSYSHGACSGAPMLAYAMLLMEREEYTRAREVLEAVQQQELRPQHAKISCFDLAMAYEKCGDTAAAIEIIEQIQSEFVSLSADDYATMGYYYVRGGEYEKSEACNEAALSRDSSCGAAYDNRGLAAYRQGAYPQAREAFVKALELNPAMASPHFYLGCMEETAGNTEQAALYYRAAWEAGVTGLSTLSRSAVEAKYRQFCAGITEEENHEADC